MAITCVLKRQVFVVQCGAIGYDAPRLLTLELRLRVPEELLRVEVIAGLDAAVKAAEVSPLAVVLSVGVPAGVLLPGALSGAQRVHGRTLAGRRRGGPLRLGLREAAALVLREGIRLEGRVPSPGRRWGLPRGRLPRGWRRRRARPRRRRGWGGWPRRRRRRWGRSRSRRWCWCWRAGCVWVRKAEWFAIHVCVCVCGCVWFLYAICTVLYRRLNQLTANFLVCLLVYQVGLRFYCVMMP